jgi:hypothetical protein
MYQPTIFKYYSTGLKTAPSLIDLSTAALNSKSILPGTLFDNTKPCLKCKKRYYNNEKTKMKRCIKCRKCKKCDTNYSYKRVVEVLEKNTSDLKNITIWSCKVCKEDLRYVCMLCKKYHRRVYTLNMMVIIQETAGDATKVNDIATICKACMARVKCDECGKGYTNPKCPRDPHGLNEYRLKYPQFHLIYCNDNFGAVCLECYPNYVHE